MKLREDGAALQEEIVQKLAAALEAEGLTESGTCVSASDETNIDVSLANMRAYHPDTMAAVGQINTHAYWVSHLPYYYFSLKKVPYFLPVESWHHRMIHAV